MRVKALLAALVLALTGDAFAQAHSTLLNGRLSYPEGAYWHEGGLIVAEMGADRISHFRNGRRTTYWRERNCGPTAVAPYRDGLLVLCHLRGVVIAIDAQRRKQFTVYQDAEGNGFRDPNDAYADGEGGVYFSDPGHFNQTFEPEGAVVYLGADGVAHRVASDLAYPNGIYVDQAARMLYVSETFRRRVLRYPIVGPGRLGPMEVFVDIDAIVPPMTRYSDSFREAGPDGLEIGPDGLLYVALYGEGRVLRFTREGAYADAIDTPQRFVTNMAWDPAGALYTVGPFEPREPPFRGEARRWTNVPHP
ncbi:MAG: SMP-30/gluconolactonase/LRE family protein [Hyphomonadaceae bacterium]